MRLWKREPEAPRPDVASLMNPLSYEQAVNLIDISLHYRAIYCVNPKAGCSTIRNTLQRLEWGELSPSAKRPDVHDRRLSPLLTPLQVPDILELLRRDDFFKFTFVRNPYTRLLSHFLSFRHLHLRKRKRLLAASRAHKLRFYREFTFHDFVDTIAAQTPAEMNHHWRAQYHNILYDRISHNFIGKLENFDRDFDSVRARLSGAPSLATHRPHATGAANRLHDFFDSELKEKVYSLYRLDFETFGYGPELPGVDEATEASLS